MHNKNRVNLFFDVATNECRGRKKKLALYIEISAIYKSSRRFHARTVLSPAVAGVRIQTTFRAETLR